MKTALECYAALSLVVAPATVLWCGVVYRLRQGHWWGDYVGS